MRPSAVAARAILAVLAMPGATMAQPVDGAQLFARRCATCHNAAPESRAPDIDALRARSPQAVLESLTTGAMRPQGARLSGTERRAVAEFITGRSIAGDVTGSAAGQCGDSPPPPVTGQAASAGSSRLREDSTDGRRAGGPTATGRLLERQWTGWSPSTDNTRFQTAEHARLPAADVPRLVLKWAFGFPDASVAWSQPTVAGGRLFVGSQNGTVYSLDAATGCIRWTFAASGGVRTAVAVDGGANEGRVYFGDTAAQLYALEAATGRLLWMRRVDEHPLARITGSPSVHGGRVYVGVSSYEESQGADPQYACCTFRGSVAAFDAERGALVWKTHTIADEPQRRGTSSAGVPLWGPAGAAVWSAPTIDVRRNALYVATGNMYAAPAHRASNAVLALDLESGAIRWMQQATPDDIYLTGCRNANPNCPAANGPDHDFGSPPMLVRTGARELLVIGQKSGMAYAMDPDRQGAIVWRYRAGAGGVLGGIEWGAAADGQRAYFAVSDMTTPQPGGLHAVNLLTGERLWHAPPARPLCSAGRGCSAAQSAAVTAIDGIVFSGSNDGALRAYDATDGRVVWEFDTNREFATTNGVPARGASMQGPGPAVADGMVFVNSGYGAFGGRAGNVLLAFGVE